MSYGPLEGVRVIDLSRLIPGGLAGLTLAQLGAEVTRIEIPPNGDHLRTWPPMVGDTGALFTVLNRGKSSVLLDYRTAGGRSQLQALLADADVLLESFRPGALAKHGLAYDDLAADHPRLVYCSISGYGQSGSLKDLPSHGLNLDGATGHLLLESHSGSEGPAVITAESQAGLPAAVVQGGTQAAMAICAALVRARSTGEGSYIDVSCWDAALASDPWLSYKELNGLPTNRYRASDETPRLAPYATLDGEVIVLCPVEPHLWQRFCDVVGRPDLATPPADADWDAGASSLHADIAAIVATRTLDEWMTAFGAAGVPASPVCDRLAALTSAHAGERHLVHGDEHSGARYVGGPLVFDGVRASTGTEVPALGQHTEQVLAGAPT